MMSIVNDIQSMATQKTAMETSVLIAKKGQQVADLQGQSALKLINSASNIANASGANSVARGTGLTIDVVV